MNFFQAFLGTCRGAAAFIELRKQPVWKVLVHLLLIVLISCICIGIGRFYALKYFWSRTESNFVETFGDRLVAGPKGILPEKDVEVSRRQELPYNGLIVYVSPKGPEKNYLDETMEGRNYIIIWTPGDIYAVIRNQQNGRWLIQSLLPGKGEGLQGRVSGMSRFIEGNGGLNYTQMRENFSKIIADYSNVKKLSSLKRDEQILSIDLFRTMYIMMAVFNGIAYFLLSLILIGFGTLIYMVIFVVMNSFQRGEQLLSPGEMFRIVIYCAFPVLIVVNVLPMLQLPLGEWHDKLFLIGWIIYINVVRRYLEKNRDFLETAER